MDFHGGSGIKNLPAKAGDSNLIPRLGRSPGGGNGNPLQYLAWEIPWIDYSPWGRKELDMTEWLKNDNK